MKQIILSSTILKFTWLVIDGFMEENGLVLLSQKAIRSLQYRRFPQENLPTPNYKTQTHTKISPPQKEYLWIGGSIYHENRDINTGYQKFVRIGDQKWEMQKLQLESFFFVWYSYSLLYTGSFQVPSEKNHPHL